jgi:hypothetical protein
MGRVNIERGVEEALMVLVEYTLEIIILQTLEAM